MKVYVITKGEYSDYGICAVTTDKEKAELLREKFSDRYEPADIEEYDTDASDNLLKYKNVYDCYYYLDSKDITIRETSWSWLTVGDLYPYLLDKDRIYVKVNADNEEMALKKASDIFAKFRAEKEGL